MYVQIDEVAFFVLHYGRLEVKVGVEGSLVLLGVVKMRGLQRNLSSCCLSGRVRFRGSRVERRSLIAWRDSIGLKRTRSAVMEALAG